jgi:hypothetical protein
MIFVTAYNVFSTNHKQQVKTFLRANRIHDRFIADIIHWGVSATTSTHGFTSSLVRAFNLFSGLAKYEYSVLNKTSLYGVTTVDF